MQSPGLRQPARVEQEHNNIITLLDTLLGKTQDAGLNTTRCFPPPDSTRGGLMADGGSAQVYGARRCCRLRGSRLTRLTRLLGWRTQERSSFSPLSLPSLASPRLVPLPALCRPARGGPSTYHMHPSLLFSNQIIHKTLTRTCLAKG